MAKPLAAKQYSLNLKDHCIMCLRQQEPGHIMNLLASNHKGIATFRPIICYLTGSAHEDNGGNQLSKVPKIKNVPPLCSSCYDLVANIYKLHQELIAIQRKLQTQTMIVRNVVKDTAVKGGLSKDCIRDKFLATISNSGMPTPQISLVCGFVTRLHQQIICEGDKSVQYPIRYCSPPTSTSYSEPSLGQLSTSSVQKPSSVCGSSKGFTSNHGEELKLASSSHKSPPIQSTVSSNSTNVGENRNNTEATVGNAADHSFEPMDDDVVPVNSLEIKSEPMEETNTEEFDITYTPKLEVDDSINEETSSDGEKSGPDSDDENPYFSGAPLKMRVERPPRVSLDSLNPSHVQDDDSQTSENQPASLNIIHPEAEYILVNASQNDALGNVIVGPVLLKVNQPMSKNQSTAACSTSSIQQNEAVGITQKKKKARTLLHQCDLCPEKNTLGNDVFDHLKKHVGADYTFYCNDCGCGYLSSFRLKKFHHNKTCQSVLAHFPNITSIACKICDFTAERVVAYKSHLEKHEVTSPDKQLACPLCPAKFAYKNSVEFHLEEKHLFRNKNTLQYCELCQNRTCHRIDQMREHMLNHHQVQNPITCRLCSAQFATVQRVMTHQLAHRKREKIMSCHACNDKFNYVRNLHSHYFKKHGIGEKFSCKKCYWQCFSKTSLENHVKRCKSNEGISRSQRSLKTVRLDCPECPQTLSNEDLLLQHRIQNHGHPPISCPSCDKTFTHRMVFRKHSMSAHRGISRENKSDEFSCDKCDMSFQYTSQLKSHMISKHSKETPFFCDICEKQFKEKGSLKRHTDVIHLQTAPRLVSRSEVCEICGKVLKAPCMKSHMLTHSKERPFSCEICGQRFRQRVCLATHLKSHKKLGKDFKPKGEMERGVRKGKW